MVRFSFKGRDFFCKTRNPSSRNPSFFPRGSSRLFRGLREMRRLDQVSVRIVGVHIDDDGAAVPSAVIVVLGPEKISLRVVDDLLDDAVFAIELVGAFLVNDALRIVENPGHRLQTL